MKFKSLLVLALLLMLGVFSQSASTQAIGGSITINWINPTTTVPPESFPLTGALALTEIQIVVSKNPIDPNYSGVPTIVVSPAPLTTQYILALNNGDTVHVRMRACHKPGGVNLECSDWTNEATKNIVVNTKPDVPSSVTIDITINATSRD